MKTKFRSQASLFILFAVILFGLSLFLPAHAVAKMNSTGVTVTKHGWNPFRGLLPSKTTDATGTSVVKKSAFRPLQKISPFKKGFPLKRVFRKKNITVTTGNPREQ